MARGLTVITTRPCHDCDATVSRFRRGRVTFPTRTCLNKINALAPYNVIRDRHTTVPSGSVSQCSVLTWVTILFAFSRSSFTLSGIDVAALMTLATDAGNCRSWT